MSRDIFDEANEHFLRSGRQYEYGRPDMRLSNRGGDRHTDGSRTEQDNDHDGRLGVDCSSFVWRGMRNAGYDVPAQPFSTHDLFEGSRTSAYARQHFDVVSAADARAPGGSLQPGDVLMFRAASGGGQHVGIFKGYDAAGHIQFIGSQVSTGPAEVTVRPGGYWDGEGMHIVGALRAKPEFQVREPQHGRHGGASPAAAAPTHAAPAHASPTHAATPGMLREGASGARVTELQSALARLDYRDERGHAIVPDGDFGPHTKAALERFQRNHGLEADGVAGPRTMAALSTASPRLDSAMHPDHPLYATARDAVHRLDAQQGRTPDAQSDRIAAAVTVAARGQGMQRVDHAALSDDASRVYAIQGETNSPHKRVAEVATVQAANTSIEESSRQWQAMADQGVKTPAPEPQIAPPQPQMSAPMP